MPDDFVQPEEPANARHPSAVHSAITRMRAERGALSDDEGLVLLGLGRVGRRSPGTALTVTAAAFFDVPPGFRLQLRHASVVGLKIERLAGSRRVLCRRPPCAYKTTRARRALL